jgi:heptose I phosphotransferase
MRAEIWLDEQFTALWQGKDPFHAASEIKGQVVRALEQRQTLAFEAAGNRYFIKRHAGVRWPEILKNLLTLRLPVVSARNEFTACRMLATLGVQVPRVAAYGRRGLLPSRIASFLVTKDVGPHQSLEDLCRPWRESPPAFSLKRTLILELARISRLMHGAGICHRDFYLCHFLRLEHDGSLVLIDLHRALSKPALGERWMVKDLGGLYFSAMDIGLTRRDLYRFMCSYHQRPLRAILQTEAGFWQAVQVRALALYRKHTT